MFPLTHLSLKMFSNGTAIDDKFVDSTIFNRIIVHGQADRGYAAEAFFGGGQGRLV
jgi:hypothetical protein